MEAEWGRVGGHEKLIEIFGYWPSFHDAEVLSLTREQTTNDEGHRGFAIQMVLHTWETNGLVNEKGQFQTQKHTQVTIRLDDCADDELKDFTYQNVVFELRFLLTPEAKRPLLVEMDSSCGLFGTVQCIRAEVIKVAPCAGF